jgi:hypothetical protein
MKLGGCEVFIKCEVEAVDKKGKKKTTWEKMDEFGRKTSKDGRNTFCYIASQPGKVSLWWARPQQILLW